MTYPWIETHGTTAADGRHVSAREAKEAANVAADELKDPGLDPVEAGTVTSWRPTKKWWAALSGAVASIVASWVVTGAFDDVERGMVATALVALTASFWKSNDDGVAA